jgi:thiamine pyrophosphokinase
MKEAIVIGNGHKPSKKAIRYLMGKGVETIVAADGGANELYKMQIIPKYIIGDLDSIAPDVLSYYEDKCEIIKYERQTDTDIEKCIKYLKAQGYEKLFLLGVTGKRIDHTFTNISHLIKYHNEMKMVIVDKHNFIVTYTGEVEFPTVQNETISVFANSADTVINAKGLKYPLDNIRLPFGERNGTSNEATEFSVSFNIQNGLILIFRKTKLAISNDFLYSA